MTTTLFNATLALASELGVLRTRLATGGSTSTLLDSVGRTEEDDNYNGGTVWLITDAGGASAAPEGEFPIITDFANTGGVVSATFTVAPAAGDTYGIATARYPRDVLIEAINRQLVKYKMKRYDATSLDVVSAQSEYTLPAGITGANLIGVYESTVDDSNDNQWVELNFHVQEAATGSTHTVVIDSKMIGVDNDFLLEYYDWHPRLYLSTDKIDGDIPLALILPAAAAHAEIIRMRTYGSESKLDIDMLQFARQEAEKAERRYPMRYKQRRGSINEAGGSYSRETGVVHP